jgi:hypothetical protein
VGLVGVTCQDCVNRDVEERGGVVLTITQDLPGALFPLGTVRITPGAVEVLGQAGQYAAGFLLRHVTGDWGSAGKADAIKITDAEVRAGSLGTDDDGKLNAIALRTGEGRILSSYRTARGARLWCLTDFYPRGIVETCLMTPDEY